MKVFKIYRLIFISIVFFFVSFGSSVPAGSAGNKLVPNDTLTYLSIPERLTDALSGSQFAAKINRLALADREKAIAGEILAGNIPSFSRKLRPVTINQTIGTSNYELIFFTICDYLAIGSDQDYLYIPMTPSIAQYLADRVECTLPTKKMVDHIYSNAESKLEPQPIAPSDKMTTVPVFQQHTDSIQQQIFHLGYDRSTNHIFAGHKKDIIISNKICSTDRNYERVVIYGWHLNENKPIQPVYNGHIARYADYSHGVRLISNVILVNGDSTRIKDILKDSTLSVLLSSEGIINKPHYPPGDIFTSMGRRPNETRP